MKKFILLIFLMSTLSVVAQDSNEFSEELYSFPDEGSIIKPSVDYSSILIVFQENVSDGMLSDFELIFQSLESNEAYSFPWSYKKVYRLNSDLSDQPESAELYLNEIRSYEGVRAVYPSFIREGDIAHIDNCFMLNLSKENADHDIALSLVSSFDGEIIEEIDLIRSISYVIEVPAIVNIFTACTLLEKEEMVAFAQPNFHFSGLADIIPNDPRFSDQWFLDQSSDADIDAVEAWDITTGSSSVCVAVIDGHGYDMNHPEMLGKYISAYDAVLDNNDPNATHSEENHGTPCSGLIGALTNNAVGMASIGYNTMVVPIKMGYDYGSGGTFQTTDVILTRACEHVMISSNTIVAVSNSYSMGSWANTLSLRTAFSNMRTDTRNGLGAVVLASTGNDDAFNSVGYPFHYANVVGVGSTNSDDDRSWFSNYGDSTDIAAPGTDTWTIDRSGFDGYSNDNYVEFSGTSAACPIAAGIVGLMGAAFPSLTEFELRQRLYSSCEKVGGYTYNSNSNYPYTSWSTQLGYGRVNAFLAVQGGGSTLNPPTNLAANVSGSNVHLSWTAPGGGSGTEVELIYDDNVSTGAYKYPGFTMSTHMSPSGPCQVVMLKYFTTTEGPDDQFYAKVFNWSGAQPGTTVLHNSTQTAQNGAWVEVDVSGSGINVTGDFVVGFGSFTEEAYISYDANLNNGRSWDFQESTQGWTAWEEAYMIRAVVLYPNGKMAEIGASIPEMLSMSSNNTKRNSTGQDKQEVLPISNQYRNLLGLLGYKIYRNGTALNSSPVTTVYYDDNGLAAGTYNYTVTAWYDEGESDAAGPVQANITGTTLDPPTNLQAGVNGSTVNLSWVSPGGGGGSEEWIYYHDGVFENSFASTGGGSGLAQLFTLSSYPVTLTELRFFTSDYANWDQALNVYVLSGDGNTILGGPFSTNGVYANWVNITTNITISQSSFMIATINTMEDGPYVGVDESLFNQSLYFGNPTDGFTELSQLDPTFEFVGSHEAKVLYQDKNENLATTWISPNNAGNLKDLPDNHIEKDPEKAAYPENSKALLGFNIYRDGNKLNSSPWVPVTFADLDLTAGSYSYTVSAIYDEGESGTAGPVSVTVFNSGLEAPDNLGGSISGNLVSLHWSEPGGGSQEELIYDNNTTEDGYNYPGFTMSTHMSPSGPCQILSLKYMTTIGTGDNTFNAKVYNWTGSQPGNNLLYENAVNAVEGWVEVDITADNVFVDGDFVVGFGSINELSFLAFDANLNNGRSWDRDDANSTWSTWEEAYLIRAVVEYTDGSIAEIGGLIENPVEIKNSLNKKSHPKEASASQVDPIENQYKNLLGLLGYNLYRDNIKINSSLITSKNTTDELPGSGKFYYNVTAVYDEGESAFSNTVAFSNVIGVQELEKIEVKVFPNPATDNLFIQSGDRIIQIRFMSMNGRSLINENVSNKEYQLDVSNFSKGLYILYIETEKGSAASKILVK